MRTFIKFGGSIITHKHVQEHANHAVISQLAQEVHTAYVEQPDHSLLLGHGSGSFGHHYAARYGVHYGLSEDAEWLGFTLTAQAARRLNQIVVDALLLTGMPALAMQPSTSLHSLGGELQQWHTESIDRALEHRLVPVVYGDVAFDSTQGSSIMSTENLFAFLALHTPLKPDRIVLVGETTVYTADPYITPDARPIPLITAANIGQVLPQAAGSRAVDVTGGMRSKIALMWELVQALPGLEIHLISAAPGLLTRVLLGQATDEGTRIRQE
jgi:isopentenyl phosphate kinase